MGVAQLILNRFPACCVSEVFVDSWLAVLWQVKSARIFGARGLVVDGCVKRGPVLGIQRIKGFCRLYSSIFWAREQAVSLKHGVCPLDRRLVSLLLSGVVDQVEVSSYCLFMVFILPRVRRDGTSGI